MNPLAIRIAADLKAFKANMQEMKLQLETNQAAMKRMASAFDGNKVIGDANAMVKAIHDIGGASKLTDTEMRRVNSTVTEALAKYKALGREAPPELIALRDATAKVNVEAAKTPPLSKETQSRFTALGVAAGTFLGNMAWSAVSKLGAEIGQFASRGLQLNSMRDSFERLAAGARESSSKMLSGMQTASRGMVSEFDLMKGANKAMLLGLPVTAESMNSLTKAATTLGRAMGQDATKSVDDLITALGRSSPMILDNLGITVKVGEANEIYARKLGKTVEKLTEAEKKTAFYNEAMRKAIERTNELGNQTLTLSDYLGILWTSVGNKVSSGVATANVAAGSLISGMGEAKKTATSFWDSLSMGAVGAAFNLGGFGRTTSQVAAIMTNSIPPLKDKIKVVHILTEEEKALAKAFQEQVDILTGKALTKEIEKLAKEVKGAGKEGGLTAFQYAELGKRLDDLKAKGAQLPDDLHAIWRAHELLNTSIKGTANAYAGLSEILKNIGSAGKLGPARKFLDFPEPMTKAQWSAILNIGAIGPLGKPPAADFAYSFKRSLATSLEGLGGVIVGAIQGGGKVGASVFASIGGSLGADLGGAITKGLSKTLADGTKAAAGTFAKMIGGLAGPLGALAGSLLGGVFDKLFGKNQGREDAKAFAAMFGGFDALREKMLVLGDEGDKLWIALTQNTKGPAQVAQAIKAIEDALAKAEAAAVKTGNALEDTFKGPEGARGFPTRVQLQQAAADAKAAYDYMLASGEYTADVLEQAWNQWQDAMIASGDETSKRMKELTQEIASLQKAVEMETPEYDVNGVRMYGVEELRNIERLAALEAEKAALNIIQIENEAHATEEAAKQADLQAKKEFEAAKIRALDLDGYLRKLFTGGYEIPITFKLPNGVPSGPAGSSPSWFGGGSGTAPTMPAKSSATAVTITVPVLLDGREVARNQVKYIPRELDFSVGPLR